ncbi:hypothetical protein ABNF97_16945 [Plantactinospora sp. B6F1]
MSEAVSWPDGPAPVTVPLRVAGDHRHGGRWTSPARGGRGGGPTG